VRTRKHPQPDQRRVSRTRRLQEGSVIDWGTRRRVNGAGSAVAGSAVVGDQVGRSRRLGRCRLAGHEADRRDSGQHSTDNDADQTLNEAVHIKSFPSVDHGSASLPTWWRSGNLAWA
jgi:hypothetical protein